jgi:Xaa-Pro aminopeptidase
MLEENLSAWLFYNLHHKDPISDRILNVSRMAVNTRPWIYLLRRDGSAEKLVHGIEDRILDHLTGRRRVYSSRQQFLSHLKDMAGGLQQVACQFSSELPGISFLDHGTARLLQDCGFTLTGASSMIQRLPGVLDQEAIDSHLRAAGHLYDIVAEVWKRLRKEMRSDTPVWETTVQGWILGLFEELELTTDSAPIVAVGANSADPHYSPEPGSSERGAVLKPDSILQFDLWAKEKKTGAIYADISWVGILGTHSPSRVEEAFRTVVEARELALRFIEETLSDGQSVSGEQVDRQVRAFVERSGYGENLRHRTGHAIGEEVHGFGVNLDSVEFPDPRLLLEGSCFSIEP